MCSFCLCSFFFVFFLFMCLLKKEMQEGKLFRQKKISWFWLQLGLDEKQLPIWLLLCHLLQRGCLEMVTKLHRLNTKQWLYQHNHRPAMFMKHVTLKQQFLFLYFQIAKWPKEINSSTGTTFCKNNINMRTQGATDKETRTSISAQMRNSTFKEGRTGNKMK